MLPDLPGRPARESLALPVPEQSRRALDIRARRLPTRERAALRLLMSTGAIWPDSGVDRSTVRRLEAKGLAHLVVLGRTLWLGELPGGLYAAATVSVPGHLPPVPPTAAQLEEMERTVRSCAMFEAKRHNRDRGYDYTSVADTSGDVVGWCYRIGTGEHGWVTAEGQVDSIRVATQGEAEDAVRAAHLAAAVPATVLQAARRAHPTAHLLRPVAGEDHDAEGLLGWVFRCLTPRSGYGWVGLDGTVWQATFDHEGLAVEALRRWHARAQSAARAQRIVREDTELPLLPADRAQAVADAAHGEVTELLPAETGGRRLGYTYRTGTGYGWITAYGSHVRHTEETRTMAEDLIALALVQDRAEARTGREAPRPLTVDSGTRNFGEARAAARQHHPHACLFEAVYASEGDLLGWTFAIPGRDSSRFGSRHGWVCTTTGPGRDLVDTRPASQTALARAWLAHRPADDALEARN